MKEIWKDIKDYEGLYQVSNLGQIKSLPRKKKHKNNHFYITKEKLLKPNLNYKGYLYVGLTKNNKTHYATVHKLVANAFVNNTNNLPQINHKNEIKTDNRAENLEFCTIEYNHNYGTGKQRQAEKLKIKINQYNLENVLLKTWDSAITVERQLNICSENITSCCKGERKTAGGFIWRYADEQL